MPSGKSKTSGSLNGGSVKKPASTSYAPSSPTARERSHTTGGLRHSSMIVHIEKPGAKTSLPSSSRMTRLAPSRVPSSSMWLNRWSAA